MPSAREGEGLAQVEAARGVLVHWLRLEGGSVAGHRILAPTEWNFHPQGALAQGLAGLPAGSGLAGLARLLVDAVDPCVACHVEVSGDA
jgi:coenzyme F420-reducing hydrogenase alpha subunit